MKIFLVAPKSISRVNTTENPLRYDFAVWNFYIPLMSLGHEVKFIDTSLYGEKYLKTKILEHSPDLLFCIMTGDPSVCPEEPWKTILEETERGEILTFNWFCDDTWRFKNFSSEKCKFFNICSTTEPYMIEEYKRIGYKNIIYANWHANADLYSGIQTNRELNYSFIGGLTEDRKKFLESLKKNDIPCNHPKNVGFEDLIWHYSKSVGGINFSKNSNNNIPQMKARIFEIPACGGLLITEYNKSLENVYVIDKEIITFSNTDELVMKTKYLLKNPELMNKIALKGKERFLKDHQSSVRLEKTLKEIFSFV
jgi:spore maturation protein CgeB